MNKRDIECLLEQIKCLILNKEIDSSLFLVGEGYSELQEAVNYLSKCLLDINDFIGHLSKGEINVRVPDRHNFLAGYLKELHSSLRNLTWQAERIAKGDYTQRVHFLGEFSTAFNHMVEQLGEREMKLKEQSVIMKKNIIQMKSIMDSVNDWIIVLSHDSGEILYFNRAAERYFFEDNTCSGCKHGYKDLFDYMREHHLSGKVNEVFEYVCPERGTVFQIKTNNIYWDGECACAHYIQDITDYKKTQSELESMSYKDELTGLYNRRYCVKFMEELLESGQGFSICLMDLDGLKYANDTYGHQEGDSYLTLFSNELRHVSRQSDVLCRVGGDEFLAVFNDCYLDALLLKMQLLNRKLKQKQAEYPMSVSYGIVEVSEDSKLTVEELISLSDKRMYAMKLRRHKNRKD